MAPDGTSSPGAAVVDRGFRNSLRVVLAFRQEGTNPQRFYRLLSDNTAALVAEFTELEGRTVVDVGSGPGELAEAFRARGARAMALDVDFDEMQLRDRPLEGAIVADAAQMPFADGTLDVVVSSNVLEHVPDPIAVVKEMGRVVRPGGLVFVNYTLWLSPWGGHETAPWHYRGGHWAAQRYERKHGRPPKNVFGTSMFALKVQPFLRDVHRLEGLSVIDAFPRYLPRWSRVILRMPGVREVVTWNLAVALRKAPSAR